MLPRTELQLKNILKYFGSDYITNKSYVRFGDTLRWEGDFRNKKIFFHNFTLNHLYTGLYKGHI